MIQATPPITYSWRECLPFIGPDYMRKNPPPDISLDKLSSSIPGIHLFAGSNNVVDKDGAKKYILTEIIKDPENITNEELAKISKTIERIGWATEPFSKKIPNSEGCAYRNDGYAYPDRYASLYVYPKNIALTIQNFEEVFAELRVTFKNQQDNNLA